MTQFEFYKSFQFVLELILAETLFLYGRKRRSFFVLRLLGSLALYFLFSYLFPILSNNAFYCSFTFFVIFAVSVGIGKFIFAESWLTVSFCCIAGYTTQHLAYEIYTLASNVLGGGVGTATGFYGTEQFSGMFPNLFCAVIYAFIYVTVYCGCFFIFSEKLPKESISLKKTFMFVFVIFFLVIDIVMNALVVYNISPDGNTLYLVIVGIYNILCCIIALYLQFEVALNKQIETTLNAVQQLYRQAQEQYAVSKENVEIINMKCHDLKHQIRQLNNGGCIQPSVLKELERQINIYDSSIKTGNAALDLILTEKSLLCTKSNIKLSCIADGDSLGFMKEEDIYALFGNIMDNAVEAVRTLSEDKRIISLSVRRLNGFVTIKEINCYENDIKFKDGLPVTAKSDKIYHGFGLKSVKYICERYGGDFTISTEDKMFEISLLFSPDDAQMIKEDLQ